MKKYTLLILLMTLLFSCFNSRSSGTDLSMRGFYSDPDEIIATLKDAPRGYRENFLLGIAYRKQKELKKAMFYLADSCFVSHRSEGLKLYAQPVYSFIKGFHRRSDYYNDAVAEIADIFFLYREFEYVVKFTGIVGDRDRALYRDAMLLRSRALDELKRYGEALEVLSTIQKKYKDTDSAALILIRMGGVHEKIENLQAALGDYRKVLELEGAGWHQSIAVKRILDITKKSGITLSGDGSFILARGLYQSGEYRQALGVFTALAGESRDPALAEKVTPFYLRCLVRERKTAAALRTASKHRKKREMEKVVADELWAAGRKGESLKLYQALADVSGDAVALEGLERLALYADDNKSGENDAILKRYVRDYSGGSYRGYFIWRLGRNELRRRNLSGALDYFNQGLREYPGGSYADAMRFWSWKILLELGKKGEAMKLAMDLVAYHPDSTYTWTLMGKIKDSFESGELVRIYKKALSDRDRVAYLFAHLLLFVKDGDMKGRDKRIESLPSAELSPYRKYDRLIGTMALSSRNRDLFKSLEKYFSVGYSDGISRELKLIPDDDKGRKDRNIALAYWGRKYHHYYHVLYSSLDLMRQENIKENLGIMSGESIARFFPRPFGQCVKNSVKEFRIEENAVYAVMKAESLFYPRAVSSAGAVGLMQLMPPTARGIARDLKEKKYDLKDPCVSIRFGAHYIAWLKRFFKGDFDLMVAGYNAGAGNVKKWQKTLPVSDDDLFAEFIPFDETRYYIVRTRKFLTQYRLLYR